MKIWTFLLVLYLLTAGAALSAPLYPVQFQRLYGAAPQQVWRAVLTTMQQWQGVKVAQDQSTGFLSFSFTDTSGAKSYINVRVKPAQDGQQSWVMVAVLSRQGRIWDGTDQRFFNSLSQLLPRGR